MLCGAKGACDIGATNGGAAVAIRHGGSMPQFPASQQAHSAKPSYAPRRATHKQCASAPDGRLQTKKIPGGQGTLGLLVT